MEKPVFVPSLKSSILSSARFQLDRTFWGVGSAVVGQSRRKARMFSEGDGKFGLCGWPQNPSKPNSPKVVYLQTNSFLYRRFLSRTEYWLSSVILTWANEQPHHFKSRRSTSSSLIWSAFWSANFWGQSLFFCWVPFPMPWAAFWLYILIAYCPPQKEKKKREREQTLKKNPHITTKHFTILWAPELVDRLFSGT